MSKKPAEPEEEEKEPAAEGASEAATSGYKPKAPRNLLISLGIFFLLILLALGGLFTAIFSHSEDPTTIKIPAHVARSLHEDSPAQEMTGAETAQSLPLNEIEVKLEGEENGSTIPTPNMPAPADPAAQTEMPAPEPQQTESQIQLSPGANSGGEVPVLQPKKELAPQSMIRWNDRPVAEHFDKTPKIALVIDDMGMNRRNSQRIVDLSDKLTLAYLPYAENLVQQTQKAAAKGHELIVHMPMQPAKMAGNNPGPNALMSALTAEQNLQRLDENLSRFTGYIGLNNHMGSDLTANREALTPIMAEIKRRGLWFLDSRTIGNSVAGKLAAEMGVPYASRDVFLDNAASVQSVLAQLKQLENIARHRGYAVGIGHPHEATITALQQWLPEIKARGIELVPLSAVIAQRYPNALVPKYARFKGHTSLSESAIEPAAGKPL